MSAPPQVVAGAIASDIPCQKCDYNLRGLAEDGQCPECGRPVAATLAFYTPEVREAYTHWFASIRSGAKRACIASGCALAVTVLERSQDDDAILLLLPLVPCMLFFIFSGWFRLSAEPPIGHQPGFGEICRQVMSWSLLVGVLGFCLACMMEQPALIVIPIITYLTSQLLYCGDLAGRLRASAQRVMCYVSAGAVVCALGSMLVDFGNRFSGLLLVAAMALTTISLAAFVQILPNPTRPGR